MGFVKTLEGRGKRFLIRLTTRLIRTDSLSAAEVLSTQPKRILVIRQHNQMGDMLLATPALRAVKSSFPGAELSVVSAPINRGVLLNNPDVDHVFTYVNRNPFSAVRLIYDLRRRQFDLVIVLHTVSFSFTSALMGLLSGARIRAGSTSGPFSNQLSESFYHLELPLPGETELAGMNETEHNLYPLRALGIHTEDLRPIIVPSAKDNRWAQGYLRERLTPGRPSIAVHPGAGKTENVWAPGNFAAVVNLLGQIAPIDVVVLEGPRDNEHVGLFMRDVELEPIHLRGRSIGEVAAVLQGVDLVLCNDTGVMHVACAAGANTLAIFGPTDPTRWAPKCSNLSVIRGDDGNLKTVSVEDVCSKATKLLKLVDRA
ncbi:MAG: glycosyltransferase family 9 protein [Candidatus Latescibacterota bacterium]|nr:MAG: glycosyltransferase family 9 protein [Candidatus Latescibacterota bacterium]